MDITQSSDNAYLVATPGVNWTVLTGADGVTLIDAGYPGDFDEVVGSLHEIGYSVDDLQAILVTHAHIDHIGSIPRLLKLKPVPVLTSFEEARHARREYLHQATPADVTMNMYRPGMLRWITHIMAKGAMKKVSVPSATGIDVGTALDVPGKPIPYLIPGHTLGHTVYLADDVLVTGDALCTGHMLSRIEGPQVLAPFFDHDRQQHLDTLPLLADLPATTMHPGHGPARGGSVAEAVEIALSRL